MHWSNSQRARDVSDSAGRSHALWYPVTRGDKRWSPTSDAQVAGDKPGKQRATDLTEQEMLVCGLFSYGFFCYWPGIRSFNNKWIESAFGLCLCPRFITVSAVVVSTKLWFSQGKKRLPKFCSWLLSCNIIMKANYQYTPSICVWSLYQLTEVSCETHFDGGHTWLSSHQLCAALPVFRLDAHLSFLIFFRLPLPHTYQTQTRVTQQNMEFLPSILNLRYFEIEEVFLFL